MPSATGAGSWFTDAVRSLWYGLNHLDSVLAEMHRRALPEPNIDFALAVLASCAGMIRGAGEVIFAVARTAGWLAHALEEYTARTPLRPRAVYTGPAHRLAGQGQPERPGSPHD